MKSKHAFTGLLLFLFLLGCAAQQKIVKEPPPLPEGVMNARWGMSVSQTKEAVKTFQDDTDKPPFALHAAVTYFDAPAIVSYFFTPKSKKLYRADVTFNDPGVYGSVKEKLVQAFENPTFSQKDTEIWSWKDDSLLILQRDPGRVQISYMSGPLLKLNDEEGGEKKTIPQPSRWKTIFQW